VRLRQMLDEYDAADDYKRYEGYKLDALLGWCEVTGCRRRPLLAYFGEQLDADCGNCDNCLNPPATRDGTEDAQKLLSTAYRTGQMFGAAHLVDVLTGKHTDKVHQHGHSQLSVFGIGEEKPAQAWRSVIRQLVVQGYLRADAERYGALVLTPGSRAVLRGEEPVRLREDPKKLPRARSKVSADTEIAITDLKLWQSLRDTRQRLAAEQSVPPYVIFHDSTLKAMLQHRPTSEDELLAISGVGEAKLARYGKAFLSVLRETAEPG